MDRNFYNNDTVVNQSTNSESPTLFQICIVQVILIMAIFGVFGNVMIIVLFQRIAVLKALSNRTLKQSMSVLCVLQNIVCDVNVGVNMLSDNGYRPNEFRCLLQLFGGCLCYPGCYWTVYGISFMRFCHCPGYSFYFRHKFKLTLFYLIVPWCVGLSAGLLTVGDFIKMWYDRRLKWCLWNPNQNQLILNAFYSITIACPIFATCVISGMLMRIPVCIPQTKVQMSIISSVMVVFLSSLILCGPFVVVMRTNVRLPETLLSLFTLLGCLNSSVNCVIYGWISKCFCRSLILSLKGKGLHEINLELNPVRRKLRFVLESVARKRRVSVDYS